MTMLYLVIRLNLGQINYIEEFSTKEECIAAVSHLEIINHFNQHYRCLIELADKPPIPTLMPEQNPK